MRNKTFITAALATICLLTVSCESMADRYMTKTDGAKQPDKNWNRNRVEQPTNVKNDSRDYGEMGVASQEQPSSGDKRMVAGDRTAEAALEMLEYSLNGKTTVRLEADNAAERELLHRLETDLAKGHAVTIAPTTTAQHTTAPAGDTLTFTTTDIDRVIPWTRRMVRRGYAVTIDYNADSGVYTCTAVLMNRKKKRR